MRPFLFCGSCHCDLACHFDRREKSLFGIGFFYWFCYVIKQCFVWRKKYDFFLFISLHAQRNEAKKRHHERQPAFCLAHSLPTYTAQQNLGSLRSWTPAPELFCTCLFYSCCYFTCALSFRPEGEIRFETDFSLWSKWQTLMFIVSLLLLI